ncbi:hypothetical protein L1987_65976 [Smallanthus sonchifolius]|uniref:Uncharacterized protein n=1 Tax=Smallanthus sonchifolius TaxID=185202 RepID=A0ACB9BW10_9ASTR|nr:hypothetical protein L1987_65976 [Smallanthus sonchifolius]
MFFVTWQRNVIGFILCSTDGLPVNFKIRLNSIEKLDGALKHQRELRFYNSTVRHWMSYQLYFRKFG